DGMGIYYQSQNLSSNFAASIFECLGVNIVSSNVANRLYRTEKANKKKMRMKKCTTTTTNDDSNQYQTNTISCKLVSCRNGLESLNVINMMDTVTIYHRTMSNAEPRLLWTKRANRMSNDDEYDKCTMANAVSVRHRARHRHLCINVDDDEDENKKVYNNLHNQRLPFKSILISTIT
ncbi:hypothetical protein BLOT_007875, partial [Blomia tropicalis]